MKQIYLLQVLPSSKLKRLLLLGLLLPVLLSSLLGQKSINKVSFSFQKQTASQCFSDLEQRYGLQFSFNATALAELEITASVSDLPLEKALGKLLSGTAFKHQFYPPNTVLVSARKEPEMRTICGYVRDEKGKSPIAYVNVFLVKGAQGTTTNEAGFFSMTAPVRNDVVVELSYLGYQTKQLPLRVFQEDKCLTTFMAFDTSQMTEIVVIDKAIRLLNTAEEGAGYEMKPNQLNALPGWGMPDVLRTVQLLPGVSAEDELATQLSIRGGTPDQNLLMWEGIPVYHTGHFFGLQSIFNPAIIDRVEVYRGGFSARYGGRVAGLLNIETDLSQEDSLEITTGANLLSFHGSVKAPIRAIKSNLLFSVRRSFTDIWPNATYQNLFNQVTGGGRIASDQMNEIVVADFATTSPTFFFADSYFKWQSQITNRTQLQISGYSASDELEYVLASKIDFFFRLFNAINQENEGGSFKFSHEWNEQSKTRIEFSTSSYDNQFLANTSFDPDDLDQFSNRLNNTLRDETLRVEQEGQISQGFQYRLGLQTSTYQNDISYKETRPDTIIEPGNFNQHSEVLALYFDGDYRISDEVYLDIGLRTSLHEGKSFWEPRFQLDAALTKPLHLKIGMAWNNQYLFQTEVPNELNLAERQWVLASNQINFPIRSLQSSIGLQYSEGPTLIELDIYRKWLNNLITTNLFLPRGFNAPFSIGEGKATGMDLLFKQKWPNLQLWIAYSLASSNYIFPTINNGEAFPTATDQRHNLRIAPILSLGKFDLSLIYQLRSGSPNTEVVDIRLSNPNAENPFYVPVYAPLNSSRLPGYQRLDFSASYSWGKYRSKGKVGLSIFNLLNHKNIGAIRYNILQADPEINREAELLRIEQFFLRFTPNFFVEYTW